MTSTRSCPWGFCLRVRRTCRASRARLHGGVQTDAPRGLQLMKRRGLEKSMEGDFETDSMRYKSTERYIPDWTDPRAVYGTPGL